MKKTLKILSAFLVPLVELGFLLPAQWKVERAIVMAANPAKIYPYIANMKTGWPQWSEFDKQDPGITYTYGGPEEGTEAVRSWTSSKMGNGSQRIMDASIENGVKFHISMESGFVLDGHIKLDNLANGTKVTWTDYGSVGMNPIHRYMVFFMDGMMGSTLERSLANLKQKVESN